MIGSRRPWILAAVCLGLALAPLPATAATEKYTIDPEHTAVTFSIRHFFSRVPGRFTKFGGVILLDQANLASGSVTFDIETASIDTNDEARDKHLRSDDFFAVQTHPRITFVSKSIRLVAPNRLEVEGDLSIRGITRSAKLDVDVLGFGKVYGAEKAAFEARTKINRQDFKVSWNDLVEGGGYILGDDVDIVIHMQAKREAPQPAAN